MTGAFLKHDSDRAPAGKLVLLSGKDVDDATRLMKLLVEGQDADLVRIASAGEPEAGTRQSLIDAARLELFNRRRRASVFPDGMFGEPAWDILLQLYVEQYGPRLNIARLTTILDVPVSSALRWLGYLQDRQLVQREENPTDQRSVFVRLTIKGIDALDAYFSETLTQAP